MRRLTNLVISGILEVGIWPELATNIMALMPENVPHRVLHEANAIYKQSKGELISYDPREQSVRGLNAYKNVKLVLSYLPTGLTHLHSIYYALRKLAMLQDMYGVEVALSSETLLGEWSSFNRDKMLRVKGLIVERSVEARIRGRDYHPNIRDQLAAEYVESYLKPIIGRRRSCSLL